tara:strand:+ start:5084 stop:5239 length:156 start_codon:yes stop_codon:yes gene_type:complete
MSFKRDNKKLKNIILVAAFLAIAASYVFIESLPDSIYIEQTTKGYDLNAKF